MKHLFIINPIAGKTKPEGKMKLISGAIEALPAEAKEDAEFELYVTRARMDACDRIRAEAASGEPLRVYACGGDGTLNECVNGAAGFDNVAVTHFPCGTGNDFIKMFGAEKDRFFDLAELVTGEVRPIDLIRCNGRYSVNICSIGIDARVGTDVHKYSGLPIVGGSAGYVVSLIANFIKGISCEATVRADDFVCGPRINMVCVCNGRYYGGGFNPTNDARPDDGKMDCLVVSGVSRLTLVGALAAYAKGQYKKMPKYITYLRTDHIEVETASREVINVDGEAEYDRKMVFDLIPAGVNFIFPRNMEFFSGC